MNDIIFDIQQGGLGRPLAGEDYYSGMTFYCADNKLPSGFSTTARVKQVLSVPQAVALGIKNDYADGTGAIATITVTAVGADGDTVQITIPDPSGVPVDLGTYKKSADEADADAVGTAIVAMINGGTLTHGYSAVEDGAVAGKFTIIAPKKMGVYLNTKSPVFTENPSASTFAATIVAFTGGVASLQAVWYYHISEFFRIQPKGNLYVGFFAVPGSYAFTELIGIQNYAAGKIRQFGIHKTSSALSFADVVALNAVCNTMIGQHKESFAVLGADISATTDLTTLPDMSIRNSKNVTVDIGQDGEAQGSFLFATTGKSVTSMGATLGAYALAKVNESAAWVDKFNMSADTVELDAPALANGQITMDPDGVIDENFLDALEAKGYTFLRKFVGNDGTYRNETRTCIDISNDFAYVENVRTMQKATRVTYVGLLPALGAPIVLNPDGTFQNHTIEYFKTLAEKNLSQMERDQEISSKDVQIDPTQKVIQQGYFLLSIEIQPVGVARKIKTQIGFTVKTTS